MDRDRFDAIARFLARPRHTSRRDALRLLAASIGAGVAISRAVPGPSGEASAQECAARFEPCGWAGCCAGLTCSRAGFCRPDAPAVRPAPMPMPATCGGEYASCENQPCCDGLTCNPYLSCTYSLPGSGCALAGEMSREVGCCDGLVSTADLVCEVPSEDCAYADESCQFLPCCGGFVCDGESGVCQYPGIAATCGYGGESCENRPCCEGFGCTADLACAPIPWDAWCGYAGHSCENRPCCDGLVCTAGLACQVPEERLYP